MGEFLRYWLQRIGRPQRQSMPHLDEAEIDDRLTKVEDTTQEIEARVEILEHQSKLRGWRQHD